GNVTDGSNQRVVQFDYGLPTANEIYGFTIEAHDIMGFMALVECNINNRYKKFPNINFKDHHLAFNREYDRSVAFYTAIRKLFFPWTGYLEIFQIDSDYTTFMYLPSSGGIIDYEDPFYRYEFVDDNDDKDQWADWTRVNMETEGFLGAVGLTNAAGVFPGLDENNDFISDFNQNNNLWPDYDEPFLRYNADPPEFLFGLDLDHNTVIDRFEDDTEPDLLYPRGHRGFNAYGGLELAPGVDMKVGRLYERLLSDNRRSRATYLVLKAQKDIPTIGRLQAFAQVHRVKDNIPDDQLLWTHPGGTRGGTRAFQDPLVAQDAWINTAYMDVAYSGIPGLTVNHKMKYENYLQQGESFAGTFTAGAAKSRLKDAFFVGVIDKVDYILYLSQDFQLHPKWKSMYRRRTPLADQLPKGALGRLNEQHDLSEILFLTTTVELMPEMWLKAGLETGLFVDFLDHPDDDWEDHRHLIYAVQISFLNQSYLGYDMRVNLGLQKEWRWLESTTERNTSTFVTIFAGAGG
ncbi:MAG: hypothetical protein HY709_01625, partial [Candidatus Latescibacteria bacterium]|nr:hypothetical protein [Candidatus Latescibacterota bacterium]